MAAVPRECDEPMRKVRRTEESCTKVVEGSPTGGESNKKTLESLREALERAAPALDDTCAMILFDRRAKDASDELMAELRAHAPSCSIPMIMADVAQHDFFQRSPKPIVEKHESEVCAPVIQPLSTTGDGVEPSGLLITAQEENGTVLDDVVAADVTELPRLLLFFRDAATGRLRKMLSKALGGSADVAMSSLVVKPVYSLRHMGRMVQRMAPNAPKPSFSLMWMSASWCPPCQRILSCLPGMVPNFPVAIVNFFKADMDLTKAIFDAFQVEIIPTFVILDNEKILSGVAELLAAPENDDTALAAHLVGAKVAALQNSQQATVMTFLEKHCSQLSFGDADDF